MVIFRNGLLVWTSQYVEAAALVYGSGFLSQVAVKYPRLEGLSRGINNTKTIWRKKNNLIYIHLKGQ